MNIPESAQLKIDAYLGNLRSRLRGLDEASVRDIVEELRSHILDKSTDNGEVTLSRVDAALAGLGSPETLASQYLTDNALARATATSSPLRILDSLFRWASLSVAGFFVLLGSLVGYFFGVVLILVALAKLIHPRTAGLWVYQQAPDDAEFSFRLGFGPPVPGSHEVLGWWIVPLGLLAGYGLVVLTTHFVLWCARQYRKSRVPEQA
jgi:hypothetical protein